MNPSSQLSMQDYWQMVLRRKWLIIGLIVASLIISGALCLFLPKSWRSSSLILIEDQKIPEAIVKTMIGGSVEERLVAIQQQIMSRSLMSKIIDDQKLYQEEVKRDGVESVIEQMRKNVKVDMVGTTNRGVKSVTAFTISYAHEDPMTAMKVTAKLTSQFIEENIKVREQSVEGTAEFIEQELRNSKARLETQEEAISNFKGKYMGELPSQTESNLRALDRMQDDLNKTTDSINILTQRLGGMEKAVSEYQATGATSTDTGAGQGGQKAFDPLVLRLKELERSETNLSSEYKSNYPDLVSVRQELEKIRNQLAEKYQVSKEDQEKGVVSGKTFDPYLQSLTAQRNEVRLELHTLKERRQRLIAQMKSVESKVEKAPAREQDLAILLRDYDNGQKNYQALLEKKLNARVAESMEKRQKGEQFRIIDPANIPEKPEKPDQPRIMLMGLAAGCGIGFGLAFLLEQAGMGFRRPEEAEMYLGVPVLATIPDLKKAYDPGARKALPTGLDSWNSGGGAPLLETTATAQQTRWFNFWSGKTRANGSTFGGRSTQSGKQTDRLPNELNLVTKWRPTSVVAEQFRVGATRLALMSGSRQNTTMVVTSAVKGEGKSATACNLAYVLARDLGKPTLLIDCDMKRPMVHSYMTLSAQPGLTEVLYEHEPIDACLQHVGELPLWVLTSGASDRFPVDLSRMHEITGILSQLKSRFDYIVIDAPPILPLADMNILAGMADLLALVVKAGETRRDIVQKALNTLKPTCQVGIVLTSLWTDHMPYYMQESYYLRTEHAKLT